MVEARRQPERARNNDNTREWFQSSRGRGTSSAGRDPAAGWRRERCFNPLVVEARRQPTSRTTSTIVSSACFNPLVVEARRQPITCLGHCSITTCARQTADPYPPLGHEQNGHFDPLRLTPFPKTGYGFRQPLRFGVVGATP